MGKPKTLPEKISGLNGILVSTAGLDEQVVKAYIREQEKEEQRYEQLSLFKG